MTTDGNEYAHESTELMTLREAADRASRSVTTLRRYIRNGKLYAEKQYGRFGPEYFISVEDLVASGLAPTHLRTQGPLREPAQVFERAAPPSRTQVSADAVPIVLYQELQLKHEQLLVQYGMVRVSGLRALELGAEADELRGQLESLEHELADARTRSADNERRIQKELHEARLELEGRGIEIAALSEKVRTLEMLTRNAVTSESIEEKYRDVVERSQRIQRMDRSRHWPAAPVGNVAHLEDPDH